MAIHVLNRSLRPTEEQIEEMLQPHGDDIKLAVDLRLRLAAGGG
jgi:hypothetical protein